MRFVDDIKRDTVASDYERVVDDLVTEFAGARLTICSYGGRRPPISDLDVVVLTDSAMPPRHVRALRARLHTFSISTPTRQYLVDDEIRLCPTNLFSLASGACLNMVPTPLTQLSGACVQVTPPPAAFPHEQIALVNNLVSQVIELGDISREAVSSLRDTLKTVSRVCSFGRPHVARVVASASPSQADDAVITAFAALDDEVGSLRSRAVAGQVDTAFEDALSECVGRATRVVRDALQVYCGDFLRSVLSLESPDSPESQRPQDDDLPELARCHIAAHAVVASHPSAFRQRLEQFGPRRPFSIADSAYRLALTEQMEIAHLFEVRFQELGVPSFPLAIAGVWHQSHPIGRWAALRSRLTSRGPDLTSGDDRPGH